MLDLYRTIWALTLRQQILLIALSAAVGGLAAVPLDYQKRIINGLGAELSVDALVWLCAQLFALILLSLGLKAILGFRSAVLGEWMIRRVRAAVYSEYSDHGTGSTQEVKAGTLATMLSAESEDVGAFAGDAFSQPIVLLGTLISVLGYVAATQPRLAILIAVIVLPQILIVELSQRHVNDLVRQRVKTLRHANNSIMQTNVASAQEEVLSDFDAIYETRHRIFFLKVSIKFLLGAITILGTVGLLMAGGWLVLQGKSDIGTIVAALTGFTRISQQWRQIVSFYRRVSGVTVKFELIRETVVRLPATPSGERAS